MTSYKISHFKYIYILAVVIIVTYGIIQLAANKKAIIADDVENIVFSAESGFYDDEFDLTISASGGKVYYTLDGSIPTKDSIEYTGPLHISDASNNDNVYSMRTDVSSGFPEHLAELKSDDDPGYKVPDYKVDKCTIVRAVVYYGDDNYSDIKTASYFVCFDDKEGYENMNVISVVTDPDNLFGEKNGIYILGKRYNDMDYANSESPASWWWARANYTGRGPEFERPANCQFFDSNGKLLLAQECGIRIHGGASRAFIPKSFNLYAREEYNGQDYFYYNFFGNDYLPHAVTLANGGNDDKSELQDYLMHKLVKDMDMSTMDFVPYIMFLDGEYWGVYWLTEKYDKEYIHYHYGIDTDNVVMVKNNEIEEGAEEDLELYTNMTGFCATEDMSDIENYKQVCELIDIDSYIDYNAALIYISRHGDWPNTNYAVWRSKNEGNGAYDDNKWRWMLFDVNSGGMLEEDIDYDSIANDMELSQMFANLMKNDEFRNRLLDRIEELSDTVFAVDKVDAEIEKFNEIMKIPMERRLRRFYGDGFEYLYNERLISIREFFLERGINMFNIVEEYRLK